MEQAKAVGFYSGYSIKGNGSVDLRFKFTSVSLPSALSFVSLIGKPIKLGCKVEDKKYKLGIFSIYRLSIDRDGETDLLLRSQKDSVELESFIPLLEDEVQISLFAVESESF